MLNTPWPWGGNRKCYNSQCIFYLFILQLSPPIAKMPHTWSCDLDRDVVEALDRVSVDRLLSLHFSLEVPHLIILVYMIKHPTGAYTEASGWTFNKRTTILSLSLSGSFMVLNSPWRSHPSLSPLFRKLQLVASGHHCFSNSLPSESIQNLWQKLTQCFSTLTDAMFGPLVISRA